MTKSLLMGLEVEQSSLVSPSSSRPRALTSREQARHPQSAEAMGGGAPLPVHPLAAAAGRADRRTQSFQVGRAGNKSQITRRV
jgi:hypothetical protein